MRRFLTFAVERSLAGEVDRLKESVIGVEVFDRDPAYDPKIDPIVRTEAHRLREKIREYYEREGRDDRVLISLPKGGYVPGFEVRAAETRAMERVVEFPAPELVALPTQMESSRGLLWLSGALVACVAAGLLLWFTRKPAPSPTLVPLQASQGNAFRPSLSPDGQRVAFTWNGRSGNFDIYVKLVNTGDPLRLTPNAAQDLDPAWSPAGRQIAFLRRSPERQELLIVPALGGAERKIADLSARQTKWAPDGARYLRSQGPAWSPDGTYIAVANSAAPNEPDSIYAIGVETGERRRLTLPNHPGESDSEPAYSPRGDLLAFVRTRAGASGSPEIYVQPVKGEVTQEISHISSHIETPFEIWKRGKQGDEHEILRSTAVSSVRSWCYRARTPDLGETLVSYLSIFHKVMLPDAVDAT